MSKAMNYLEIFNEASILALTYPTLLFTGFMEENPDYQTQVGWSMIVMIILNVLVNFCVLLVETVKASI